MTRTTAGPECSHCQASYSDCIERIRKTGNPCCPMCVIHSGEPCESCGTDYGACTEGVYARGFACCSRCADVETHNESIETDQAPKPGNEFKIGDKVCWAGQSLGREVLATYRAWLWVETHVPDQPMSVRSADCTRWVDPQRERLIEVLSNPDFPVEFFEQVDDIANVADYLLAYGVTFKEES